MKLRSLTAIAVLLSIWIASPEAWGLINRKHIFEELEDQTIPTPTAETAVIVFLLPYEFDKDVGRFAIPFTGTPMGKNTCLIYDVTNGTPKLAGAIKANTKFAYEVPAGRYLFQSIGLLEANVLGGRIYYVLVEEPLVARFAGKLYPVRNGGKGTWQYSNDSLKSALEASVLVKTTPKAFKEFEKESWIKRTSSVLNENLKQWNAYSESERREFSLYTQDGILVTSQSNQDDKSASQKSMSPTYSEELEALEALRDDGIFSEEEFQKQKQILLEKQ